MLLICIALLYSTDALAAKIDRKYKKTARKYEITVTDQFNSRNGKKSGDPLTGKELEDELERFFAALEHLTVDFVKKSGVSHVLICNNLKLNGKSCSGIASGNTIFLKAGCSDKTVAHELFHVFDPQREQRKWTKLNPKEFVYTGSKFYSADLGRRDKRKVEQNAETGEMDKHFVSKYAQSFEREDRAETFAYMVIEGPRFLERVKKSDVLKKKMEFIIEMTDSNRLLGRDFWNERLGLDESKENSP